VSYHRAILSPHPPPPRLELSLTPPLAALLGHARQPLPPGHASPPDASPGRAHQLHPPATQTHQADTGRLTPVRPPPASHCLPPHPAAPLHSCPSPSRSPPSVAGHIVERVTTLRRRPLAQPHAVLPRRRPGPGMTRPAQPSLTTLTAAEVKFWMQFDYV
jgi:hypothetical protein